jgi:hypothetical protein
MHTLAAAALTVVGGLVVVPSALAADTQRVSVKVLCGAANATNDSIDQIIGNLLGLALHNALKLVLVAAAVLVLGWMFTTLRQAMVGLIVGALAFGVLVVFIQAGALNFVGLNACGA